MKMSLRTTMQPQHNAFTKARVRLHKRLLVTHEQEKRLSVDLGLPRAGFWACEKTGGPVHFWLCLHHGDLFNLACAQLGSALPRKSISSERNPVTTRRVCQTCRSMVLALDW